MTNHQFWNKLDSVFRKKMSPEIMAEFAALLIQGYEEDLELIISCIDDPIQDNTAYQSYIDTG